MMLIGNLFAVCVAGWWLFGPVKPITGSDFVLHVKNTTVIPGDELVFTVTFCADEGRPAVLSRQILDTVEWPLPDMAATFSPGCATRTMTQRVPKALAHGGIYRLIITAKYAVNPLRTVTYRFESDPFVVTPDPPTICAGCSGKAQQ